MHQIHLKSSRSSSILKCGVLKLTYLFISEAKKLELEILCPCTHDHKHIVGTYHLAEKHIEKGANALESRSAWANMAWNSELLFS
jgi:hypothetical protein